MINETHDYDLNTSTGEIFLFGREEYTNDGSEPGIEYAIANRFIRNLSIMKNLKHESILIHMKTCGGDWDEGMAIYDALLACPQHTTIINYAHARSMSSIIFQAANRRVMMPNSTFMAHRGEQTYHGTCTQFETQYHEMKKADKIMFDIYAKSMRKGSRSNKTDASNIRWLKNQMRKHEDVFYSPQETVALGFADEIFTSWDKYE